MRIFNKLQLVELKRAHIFYFYYLFFKSSNQIMSHYSCKFYGKPYDPLFHTLITLGNNMHVIKMLLMEYHICMIKQLPLPNFFLGLLVDEWFLINTRTFQITFIRIFLSYIFYNLQSCFFNVKMSNKIVGSSRSMSKFYLSVSYIKYNLRRHLNTIIIKFF